MKRGSHNSDDWNMGEKRAQRIEKIERAKKEVN